ncbi:MAG TPA: inositol monophosphatase family protein [Acidobacteriaceae bacterium]|nr:inositol monophosphatase family protein [Acidobacteriaceae bacterium]
MKDFPPQLDLGFAAGAAGIALEAGELLRGYFERGVATEYKGDVDLVTEADRSSEKLIVSRLKERFPEHGIFGEEGTRSGLERTYRWYVDPLDGTTNFAHGFPFFNVSLGLEHRPSELAPDQDGELVAGVVYDPVHDELFAAEQSRGAWLLRSGKPAKRLQVSTVQHLQESLLATGFPSHKRHANPNIHFYQQLTLRSHGVRRAGAAALDLAYCAAGRVEAFWEFNLNPWDTAAGALLVLEAGGAMLRFDGAPFRLNSEEVMATNGLITGEILSLFADMFAGREIEPVPTPAEFAARRSGR